MGNSVVEIPEGSGHHYRYQYDQDTQKTLYRGPVGNAPALNEEEFRLAVSELASKHDMEPWRGGYINDDSTIGLFETMLTLTFSKVGQQMKVSEFTSYPPSRYTVKDMIWVAGTNSKGKPKHNKVKLITTPDSKHIINSALYNKTMNLSGKNKRILVKEDYPIVFEGVSGKVAVVAPIVVYKDKWDSLIDPTKGSLL